MILDLSAFRQETLDIAMLDGTTLRVGKPSQRLVIEVLKLRDLEATSAPEAVLRAVDELVLSILNGNIDHRTFAPPDLDDLTLDMKTAIIDAFGRFILKLQTNPT